MKSAVIVFPASNCDRDMKVCLTQSMGSEPYMVWHGDTEIPEVDLIALPGGFSYGDYLRCGAMASHSPIMREVKRRAEQGVYVLGVCNGFQVLTEAGLLPGVLMRNADLKFVCKDVHLRVEDAESVFTRNYRKGQVLRVPVAHHDGNYFTDGDTLKQIQDNRQIAFRYCTRDGGFSPDANPNGSLDNIAGVFNKARNVLGLMPHPERLADPLLGGTDGRPMFDGLVEALAA
ncbi:MAG: phosphoribosylformylglycinamidine synthase subunit PurQ [Rhodospirillales bacterium]|nr:phosphoribosylformylglycinamidine synthase subunit PurQ [Rhodospirillales bacterium]